MNVLFASKDPGGTNMCAPVIEKLLKQSRCTVWAEAHALKIYHSRHIRATDVTGARPSELGKHLDTIRPDIVCIGTSMGPSIDKMVTILARSAGIPTLSLLDSWSNYARRYSGPGRLQRLRYLPDYIGVIDARMKRECQRDGIPAERLIITGSPYLYETLRKFKKTGKAKHQTVFLSQPLSAYPYSLFSEWTALEDFLRYPRLRRLGTIVIKLHPKEKRVVYMREVRRRFPTPSVKIVSQSLYPLLTESQLIVGMNSITLLEAALAGKSVISYQPGITSSQDVLPSNRWKLSQGCYTRTAFHRSLDYFVDHHRLSTQDGALLRVFQEQFVKKNPVDGIIQLLYALTRTTV